MKHKRSCLVVDLLQRNCGLEIKAIFGDTEPRGRVVFKVEIPNIE